MNAALENTNSLPSPEEMRQAKESTQVLAAFVRDQQLELTIHSKAHGTQQVGLPNRALKLLIRLLGYMGQGHAVMMVPQGYEMTTQQAADFLNVSRPFLIGLLDADEISYHKVGTHRRLQFEDVLAYRNKIRNDSEQALDELAELGQELGDY